MADHSFENRTDGGGFMLEADLRGQADPTGFFDAMIKEIFSSIAEKHTDEPEPSEQAQAPGVLIVSEKSEAARAYAHSAEKAGIKPFKAGPSDSYNYMLDVIINESICLLVSDSAGISGILKHSAELRLDAVMISDRFVPPGLAGSIVKAWGCDVYMHYTRPELAGLGAFGPLIKNGAEVNEGLAVCDDLDIEIIDPETGTVLPCRKGIGGRSSPGRWGEIVITGTFPAAEPMVSYRTGDVSRMLDDSGRQIIDITKRRTSM